MAPKYNKDAVNLAEGRPSSLIQDLRTWIVEAALPLFAERRGEEAAIALCSKGITIAPVAARALHLSQNGLSQNGYGYMCIYI